MAATVGPMGDLVPPMVGMVDMEVRMEGWALIQDTELATTVMEDTAQGRTLTTRTVFVIPSKQDHNVSPHK